MSDIDTPASEGPDRQWDKSQSPCRIYPIAIAGRENNPHTAQTRRIAVAARQRIEDRAGKALVVVGDVGAVFAEGDERHGDSPGWSWRAPRLVRRLKM